MPVPSRHLLVPLTALLIVCAARSPHADVHPHFDSRMVDTAPVIDGTQAEWTGLLRRLDSAPISLGVQNDARFIYIAIVTSDPGMRALLSRAGFTLWWDPSQKDRKTTGVAVPRLVTMVPPAPSEDGKRPRRGEPERDVDPVGHLEVIGPGKDDRRRLELPYLRSVGMDAAGSVAEDVLVYELQIPLDTGDAQPYAIGAAAGSTLALGIETGEIPKYRPPDDGRRGGTGGGMGGFGGFGRRRGPGGGGPGGEERERTDDGVRARPVNTWVTLRLATAPAATPAK